MLIVAKYLQVPRLAPALVIDLVEAAGGNSARIVDQNINVGILGGEFVN
jgi:hypothetical protein